MSQISPTPLVAREIQSWQAGLQMNFILAEDVEGGFWIIESCPVGRHIWTLEQAASLSCGTKTGPCIKAAISLGNQLLSERSGVLSEHDNDVLNRSGVPQAHDLIEC